VIFLIINIEFTTTVIILMEDEKSPAIDPPNNVTKP
jgi:hypothetical protein